MAKAALVWLASAECQQNISRSVTPVSQRPRPHYIFDFQLIT